MKKITNFIAISTISIIGLINPSFAQDSMFGKRTHGDIIFSIGGNTFSNSSKAIYEHMNLADSRFSEIGYTFNTRLSDNSNLLHLNYGLIFSYNNVRLNDGYAFKQGEKEVLTIHDTNIKKVRLKNSYFQIPVHLEFDFYSERRVNKLKARGKNPFKRHRGFKIGIGGFWASKINTKQFIDYKDGKDETQKNKLEVNKYSYGLSFYLGYNFVSIYAKYDIQALFKQNKTNNPHNFSFGLRFNI